MAKKKAVRRKAVKKTVAKKKLDRRSVRKLTKVGGKSIAVTIPIHLVRKLKWRERQKVTVRRVGKRIVVEDWKK